MTRLEEFKVIADWKAFPWGGGTVPKSKNSGEEAVWIELIFYQRSAEEIGKIFHCGHGIKNPSCVVLSYGSKECNSLEHLL